MDLSNLSERDRKIVEHNQRRVADIKIVAGLMSKGYSDEKIAEMMGSPVQHIHFLQKQGRLKTESMIRVLDKSWRTLAFGTHEEVMAWLSRNPEAPSKMISIGKDHQILSVSEYLSLHG